MCVPGDGSFSRRGEREDAFSPFIVGFAEFCKTICGCWTHAPGRQAVPEFLITTTKSRAAVISKTFFLVSHSMEE